jgi:hypothetical protein
MTNLSSRKINIGHYITARAAIEAISIGIITSH